MDSVQPLNQIKMLSLKANTLLNKLFHPTSRLLPGIVCLAFEPGGFSIICGESQPAKFKLTFYEQVKTDPLQLPEILNSMVSKHQLQNIPCKWMITPEHYQMFLMEELPVPEEEFQAAIPWKIKDLISLPLDDVLVEHFSLPISKAPNAKKMMMVVVTRKSYVSSLAAMIKTAGLHLKYIDISEFALRNLALSYDRSEQTTLTLDFYNKKINLMFIRNKTLYFSRRIDFDFDVYNSNEETTADVKISVAFDKIALEIQRSLDYFQSQWRLPLPLKIYLTPLAFLQPKIAEELSSRLLIPLEVIDLNKIVDSGTTLELTMQEQFMNLIGCAIRHEGADHAAN